LPLPVGAFGGSGDEIAKRVATTFDVTYRGRAVTREQFERLRHSGDGLVAAVCEFVDCLAAVPADLALTGAQPDHGLEDL
jgi:hypothetical protein